jgi:hypothetical protein
MILTYKDKEIQQRDTDGYVNLTQMAQANGVKINNWLQTDNAKEYIKALESDTALSASELLIIKKGGISSQQGTWSHPLVAIAFAQWISPQFHIWCNKCIKIIFETGSYSVQQPKKAIAVYSDRIMDLEKNLVKQPNTWCIAEKANYLMLRVEKLGYPIDIFDLLDGSVGIHWSSYRSSKEWAVESSPADYHLDNHRGTRVIKAYDFCELGYFAQWLETIYVPVKMPVYLDKKYGTLVKI